MRQCPKCKENLQSGWMFHKPCEAEFLKEQWGNIYQDLRRPNNKGNLTNLRHPKK